MRIYHRPLDSGLCLPVLGPHDGIHVSTCLRNRKKIPRKIAGQVFCKNIGVDHALTDQGLTLVPTVHRPHTLLHSITRLRTPA